jgi:hypothetical protein
LALNISLLHDPLLINRTHYNCNFTLF